MSSSRATIAAGTSPPRVMQTIAANGPASASRQASARASRWNWSQETGNGFFASWLRHQSLSSTHIEHEIEPRGQSLAALADAHQQLARNRPSRRLPGSSGK